MRRTYVGQRSMAVLVCVALAACGAPPDNPEPTVVAGAAPTTSPSTEPQADSVTADITAQPQVQSAPYGAVAGKPQAEAFDVATNAGPVPGGTASLAANSPSQVEAQGAFKTVPLDAISSAEPDVIGEVFYAPDFVPVLTPSQQVEIDYATDPSYASAFAVAAAAGVEAEARANSIEPLVRALRSAIP